MNIIQAIESDKVFKPLFRDLRSWRAWLVFLKALFALPMDKGERRVFKKCTGLKKAPTMQAREAYVVAGRRSGKSFISAVQKARTFTIVSVSSSAIFSVSGNAVGWVNRNTIFQCTGNDHTSLF